mgnify:CR=1 FL=1
MNDFLKDNVKWLLTVVFSTGIIYSEIKDFQKVEERLNKKIKIISSQQETINDLENRIIVLETTK